MKQLLKFVFAFSVAVPLLLGTAFAEERGTAAEAKKMVEDAATYIKQVGPEKAFAEFSTPGGKWHNKDLYLFCYKMDGTNVCHGANKALIGKNLIDLKTADGQFLIRNFVKISQAKGKRLD